ncbi:bifunctional purine biosynthesis protein PurH [Deferribacter desulfuricans SSM1]|uniref:Bifunctional purine biosynthesis protein PurH n=1 Tax=Deferribacter desulfuricans (strain DSM 14783 / JCM 11476 / NBRC 101012 / SSM1) TaxID=639282 RepID=D3PDI3_DEFDS|nr:bifunctional phosphoribosylaminoimidazolecarboxamide formyltransferase/IMP cyclohydrolase [Deferribacter desulfuricans]BAI80656.1 bifunctional purine biosynthesis protein PurH [Deferribacter desulfuricans SSM1]
MNLIPKRALISVSEKSGIVEFATELVNLGIEIISTGGTAKLLKENGIDIVEISDFTGFPEILDGRVKTLHPKVHAGILNIRDNENHQKIMKEMGLVNIDLVVVNLYPFEKTVAKEDVSFDEAIENIDIGGPTMVRSAAKNHKYVAIVVDNNDYNKIIDELKKGGITYETRLNLARKAFTHTAVYDALISNYFNKVCNIVFPDEISLPMRKAQDLRYGENPHQKAAFYKSPLIKEVSVSTSKQLHGKELSFNNIIDINAALELVKEFDKPAAVIIKHTNPCGVGTADNLLDAYNFALECDPVSAFGGIVAFNRVLDKETAEKLKELFLEVVIAPDFEEGALDILTTKKNLRLIKTGDFNQIKDNEFDVKKVIGGFLLQDRDLENFDREHGLKVVTKRKPTEEELEALKFAWIVVKHVKSNAIVYANKNQTVGIGAGQMSRVDSSVIAAMKARKPLKGCVMASDAFFPFRDSVDEAAKNGITAIIQPGGSIRDNEVIEAANEHNIAMIFTGMRHFKH